jgi:hypothetical protein
LTGKISDGMRGLAHKAMIELGGGKMTDAQCTEACVKAGAKHVFTSGAKVYALANQDDKDLAVKAGKTVRLTATCRAAPSSSRRLRCPQKGREVQLTLTAGSLHITSQLLALKTVTAWTAAELLVDISWHLALERLRGPEVRESTVTAQPPDAATDYRLGFTER